MATIGLFFYKRKKHWQGISITDASLVNQASQFVHQIRVKKFQADTIARTLVSLGIGELKQYNNTDLIEQYNKYSQHSAAAKANKTLPTCIDGALMTIKFKCKAYSYPDCVFSDIELRTIPEIQRFFEISHYLQLSILPNVPRMN